MATAAEGSRDLAPARPAAQVRAAVLAAILVACVAVFVWLLQSIDQRELRAIDRAVYKWAWGHRTPLWTEMAANVTALGSSTLLGLASLVAFVVLWTGGGRRAAIETAIASSAAGALTPMVKAFLSRSRPPMAERLIEVAGYSFPSGHAVGIAALLMSIALVTIEVSRSRSQRIALALTYGSLMLAVSASRVYLGVHYLSDIVAGLCLGIACALFAHAVMHTRAVLGWLRARLPPLRRAPRG